MNIAGFNLVTTLIAARSGRARRRVRPSTVASPPGRRRWRSAKWTAEPTEVKSKVRDGRRGSQQPCSIRRLQTVPASSSSSTMPPRSHVSVSPARRPNTMKSNPNHGVSYRRLHPGSQAARSRRRRTTRRCWRASTRLCGWMPKPGSGEAVELAVLDHAVGPITA